jgi:hypothetical protein
MLTLRTKVEAVDFSGDMQHFLEEKQTGSKPPNPVEYEPYNGTVLIFY